MSWYCEKCKKLHTNEELCPNIREILKRNPQFLVNASNFTAVAGQEYLVSTQALDTVAQQVNKIAGTNLRYEGAFQTARDIQVFQRLDTENYVRKGVFRTPEAAKQYLESATKKQLSNLNGKLTGSSQEIDWLRMKQGQFSRLFEKSELLNGNAPGIDGITVNRFTGDAIEKVTAKAAQTRTAIHTNTQQIAEAIKKGTLDPNDTVFGVEGIKEELAKTLEREIKHAREIGDTALEAKLRQAKQGLKIIEKNTTDRVAESNERLLQKIADGQAVTEITGEQMMQKAVQGGVIGAAIGLTVSGITSYVRYREGELTREEAYRDIGEGTSKGAITGAFLGEVMLFVPAGPIGWVAGIAIGIYIDAITTNLLDEIFGKGSYASILNASGYVMGTAVNIETMLRQYAENVREIDQQISRAKAIRKYTEASMIEVDENLKFAEEMLKGV